MLCTWSANLNKELNHKSGLPFHTCKIVLGGFAEEKVNGKSCQIIMLSPP